MGMVFRLGRWTSCLGRILNSTFPSINTGPSVYQTRLKNFYLLNSIETLDITLNSLFNSDSFVWLDSSVGRAED